MTQQPITGLAPDHRGGIWSRLLDTDRRVVDAAWRHHLDTGQHVGKCRCGQPLRPGIPYKVGQRDAYPATCIRPVDPHEVVAYGPRPAKRRERS
jgi:hypothetical protein